MKSKVYEKDIIVYKNTHTMDSVYYQACFIDKGGRSNILLFTPKEIELAQSRARNTLKCTHWWKFW